MIDNEKVQNLKDDNDQKSHVIMSDTDRQLFSRVMLDKRISRFVIQCIPLCSSCKHPYDINLDGSDLPSEIGKPVTVKCSNCGTEFEIAIFRSRDPNAPENVIYNAFTARRDDVEQRSIERVKEICKADGEKLAKYFEEEYDADKVVEIADSEECFPGYTAEETKAFIEGERRMADLHLQMLRTKDD